MALLNLSNVTSALMKVLELNLPPLYGGPVPIVAQSPDKVEAGVEPQVSVYLYHATEDPHYKNVDVPGGTVANTSLALSLFYVVTAHKNDESSNPSPLDEQALMGYALKTFHDYPVVTADTKINGTSVMEGDILVDDNKLQIIYRPLSPEDALTFWNGDDDRLVRFGAFYEVRVVLLRREEPKLLPGYVLSVGNYVLPTGVMAITASESVVRFTPPGSGPLALVASPARVALEDTTPPPGETPNNQLTLRGTRLGGGQLVLRSPLFPPPTHQLIVSAADNPDWEIVVKANRLTARIGGILNHPDLDPIKILPGIYGASVQVTSNYQLPGGLTKTLVSRTNEVAIAVTPFIDDADLANSGDPPGTITITVDPQTALDAPELADDITVVIGSEVYKRTVNPAVAVREYRIDGNQIVVGTSFNDSNPGIYPVRVIVRGVENPPHWIVVP